MKSQQELYHALEKVEGIIRDNRLFVATRIKVLRDMGIRIEKRNGE